MSHCTCIAAQSGNLVLASWKSNNTRSTGTLHVCMCVHVMYFCVECDLDSNPIFWFHGNQIMLNSHGNLHVLYVCTFFCMSRIICVECNIDSNPIFWLHGHQIIRNPQEHFYVCMRIIVLNAI
jgi:hypothetical protein